MPNGMMLPPEGMAGPRGMAGPSTEDIDRMLVQQILALPPEAKLQLLQALTGMQASQPGVQEQALGQVMGQAARG